MCLHCQLLHLCFCTLLVGAILEHEAIAGLSAGKPTGLRGRALSNSRDDSRRKDASLDSLMKAVSIPHAHTLYHSSGHLDLKIGNPKNKLTPNFNYLTNIEIKYITISPAPHHLQ